MLRILRKAKALVGLEEMGLAPATLKVLNDEVLEPTTGIVLVTGPTGSGKTTTLYAAVERLNDESKKIITCEDPVEYVIDGITPCSVASRPGITFVDSLRAIVRHARASPVAGIAKAIRGETTLSEVAENCPRSKTVRPLGRLLEFYE